VSLLLEGCSIVRPSDHLKYKQHCQGLKAQTPQSWKGTCALAGCRVCAELTGKCCLSRISLAASELASAIIASQSAALACTKSCTGHPHVRTANEHCV
jgi:hypothetical protein